MIHLLPTDRDLQHVGKLIARHQSQYSGCSGLVDFDLRSCNQSTLHLVYEFVKSRMPPPPPDPPVLPIIPPAPKPPLILPVGPYLSPRGRPEHIAAPAQTDGDKSAD
jgi:hypothetical protein